MIRQLLLVTRAGKLVTDSCINQVLRYINLYLRLLLRSSESMEHKICEGSKQNTLDLKCKKILSVVKKSSIEDPTTYLSVNDEKWDVENNLASPTPEKIIRPPRSKTKGNTFPGRVIRQIAEDFEDADDITQVADENPTDDCGEDFLVSESVHNVVRNSQTREEHKLPDKYEVIHDLFDRMESSIRLLGLRKKLPSFQNISMQVEILTKRKFSHNRLAQMKHIFPEAIQIEKILTHDESTLCMKPDMKITLLADAVKGHPDQSPSMALRNAFRARLLEFFNMHPENSDIPEALLPEPFNQRCNALLPEQLLSISSTGLLQPAYFESEYLLNSSHLSTNFCRQFSQKIVPETEKTQLLASPTAFLAVTTFNDSNRCIESPVNKKNMSSASASTSIKSPAQLIFSPGCSHSHLSGGTPSKPVSTPEKLMTETPAQPTPKRSMPTPDDDNSKVTGLLSHSARRRALIFSSPLKSERTGSDIIDGGTEQNRAASSFGVQAAAAVGTHAEHGSSASPSQTVKEKIGCVAKDCKMGQTGSTRRHQMLSSLPSLFNIVRRIFQSSNRSSITKQELVHKILFHNCDITETGEIEEQLKLLEELVPDWICGKMVSSGDFLYCIRKMSDSDSILGRLVEAV